MSSSRNKKKEKVDPFERARLKKLRSAQRREERKRRRAEAGDDGRRSSKPVRATKLHDPNDLEWLKLGNIRMVASRIMNDSYSKPAPYWLSIPHEPSPMPADFYPCRSNKRGNRIWYGFLFREHRDEQLLRWNNPKARKELTPTDD